MNTARIEIDDLPELPEGWVWARFGVLLGELRNGISTKPELSPPGVSILRISSVRPGSVSLSEQRFLPHGADLLRVYGLRDDDLLFTRYNGSLELLGVCGMVRGLGNASVLYPDKLMRVRFDHDHILPAYAELFFQSADARDRLTAQSRSSAGQQGVSGADIKSQPFALPPFEEQRRLVEAIETALSRVDAARDHISRVTPILRRFRQAVLAAACSGRLTEDWRDKEQKVEAADQLVARISNKRFVADKTTAIREVDANSLPTLPDEWTWVYLADLGYMSRGKSRHRPRDAEHLYNGPYPFIQTGDIAQSGGRITSHQQTYSEAGLQQSRLWPAGTVCITIAANIAHSAMLTYPACFPDSVVGVIPDGDLCLKEYLEFFIRTARTDLEQYAPATAQKNINIGILSDVAVPLPPSREQREVVRLVEALLGRADVIQKQVADATFVNEKLTQSILAKAFRGELVPTEAELARREDREYEPASVLLERIRAERADGTKTTPAPKRKLRKATAHVGA